jgi:hypothetical protein
LDSLESGGVGKDMKTKIYYCKHCKLFFGRNSNKKWIPSYCEKSGKNVHLTLTKSKSKKGEPNV